MQPIGLAVADVVQEIDGAGQQAENPERAGRRPADRGSPSFSPKMSPAKTSRFFVHCLGRSDRIRCAA